MIAIQSIFVVSLDMDFARKAHIQSHLPAIGFNNFEFVPATDHQAASVRALYREGRVLEYPNCFRCGQRSCACANNILIPQQVANWLSFLSVWEICSADPDAFFLICEDDVSFRPGTDLVLERFLGEFEQTEKNVLIRMAESGQDPRGAITTESYSLSDRVVMSNAAYLLSGHMAQTLLDAFDRVETTSDIWLHRDMAGKTGVQSLTIEPLLATDLSFTKEFAQFESRIHPKGINVEDQIRQGIHVKRVSDAAEYERVRRSWFQS